jgi:hypothetical protein
MCVYKAEQEGGGGGEGEEEEEEKRTSLASQECAVFAALSPVNCTE